MFAKVWLALIMFAVAVVDRSMAFAQLEVTFTPGYRVDGLGEVSRVGDACIANAQPKISARAVGVLRIVTEAASVDLDVSDVRRAQYSPALDESAPGVYVIDQPGKWWIEVRAVDFERQIFSVKKLTVDVAGDPKPDDPDPPDPPGPDDPDPPEPDAPIANDYGVGKVAFDKAPDDPAAAKHYADIYRRAADFLFGIPSLKFVVSSNDAHSRDPNRSLMAWISQQYDLVQCRDQATCAQWSQWQRSISAALVNSQTRRQFTRDDWFAALNEISRGVAARAGVQGVRKGGK